MASQNSLPSRRLRPTPSEKGLPGQCVESIRDRGGVSEEEVGRAEARERGVLCQPGLCSRPG